MGVRDYWRGEGYKAAWGNTCGMTNHGEEECVVVSVCVRVCLLYSNG